MTTRSQLVDEARTWLNTPFVHQDRTKGMGVDCVNFIAAVAEESGATVDVEFERNYRRHADGLTMLALLHDYLEPVAAVDAARRGDVLVLCDEHLRQPKIPRHLMILTELEPYWKAIHASQLGVREHRLDLQFKRRIHSVWRIRNITDGA